MSASNPSRIPFEMMAAGLPVVELYKENNIYDMPDEGVMLAEPTPEAIASSIIDLLDHPEKREQMSKFGQNYMKDFPLERGFEQFVKNVNEVLEAGYDGNSNYEKMYKKEAFKASEEAIKEYQKILGPIKQVIPPENHGIIYRILRKIYRKTLKRFFVK